MESFLLYGDDIGGPLPPNLLQPLAACVNHQVLDVAVGRLLDLTDGDVRSLVSHLPCLQNLAIRNWHNSHDINTPLTTLGSLAVIIASCSGIKTITLRVDATRGLDYDVLIPSKTLASVNVLGSCLGGSADTPQVASFLRRLSTARRFHLLV